MTRLRNTAPLAVLLAALIAAPAAADDPQCPVIGAGGTNIGDGSVLVVGQTAIGLAGSVTDDAELGAVPCWFGICLGDLDGDGVVDLSDLALMLSNYGQGSGQSYQDGDLDGDGDVDLSDLALMLSVYDTVCP